MPKQCSTTIFGNYKSYQCLSEGIYQESGKYFCWHHLPSAIAAKEDIVKYACAYYEAMRTDQPTCDFVPKSFKASIKLKTSVEKYLALKVS